MINAFIHQRIGLKKLQKIRKMQQLRKRGIRPKRFKNTKEPVIQSDDKENYRYERNLGNIQESNEGGKQIQATGFNHSFGIQKIRQMYKTKCQVVKEENL